MIPTFVFIEYVFKIPKCFLLEILFLSGQINPSFKSQRIQITGVKLHDLLNDLARSFELVYMPKECSSRQ
jgi:hypothetical protein